MSVKMTNMVWEARLRPKTKYVLLALLHLAEEDGYTVYCSKHSIAVQANLSERTVQRQLRKLEKLGWIEVAEEAKQHLPRIYKIKNPTRS
jgi:DNA-binding IscR family transcriptional regulator